MDGTARAIAVSNTLDVRQKCKNDLQTQQEAFYCITAVSSCNTCCPYYLHYANLEVRNTQVMCNVNYIFMPHKLSSK